MLVNIAILNHSICILHQNLNGNDYYDDIYKIVAEYLEKEYIVIYAAESNSHGKTIRNLAKATATSTSLSADIDIEDYVKKGQLTVIDYDSLCYQSSRNKKEGKEGIHTHNNSGNETILATQSFVKRLQSEIQNKKKEQQQYRNNNYNQKILLVGTCKPFSERDDYDGLIAYENVINNELLLTQSSSSSTLSSLSTTPTIECICCYRISTIKQISSLPLMISILVNHDSIIITTTNNNAHIIEPLLFNGNNNIHKKNNDNNGVN